MLKKLLFVLLICLNSGVVVFGQAKNPITTKIISPLLLPALAAKDHWSKGLQLTAQVTISKAFTAKSDTEWSGEIKYTLSGLPGKGQIVETATCGLKQNDKKAYELVTSDLTVTSSLLQNVNPPSRNTVLTQIYKVLRSGEAALSSIPETQKIISCSLIDAYPTGKPDARISANFTKDAMGKPLVNYVAVISSSLEGLAFDPGQSVDLIKLKKVSYQYTMSFNWDGKSEWKLSDKAWEFAKLSSVDYDSFQYRSDMLKAIPNLQKDGIDAIWGESKTFAAAKITYQQ